MRSERTEARGIGLAAAVAALLGLLLLTPSGALGSATGQGEAGDCQRAGARAAELPRAAVRRSVTCVVNRIRIRRDRRAVNRQKQLQGVAQRHARVMANRSCMKARCPGQPALGRRIRASGYLNGAERWRFALNTGCARSAAAMVREWRNRRYHRKNMLRPVFRHVGVGIVPRATAAGCESGWSTFAALFAHRVR